MICKIVFCSEFPDIPNKAGTKKEEEEHKQLESVVRFTQTQR